MRRTILIRFTDGTEVIENYADSVNLEELRRKAFYYYGKVVDTIKQTVGQSLIL